MPDGAETYYLLIEGKQQGPLSVGQVRGLYHDGVIDGESLACQPGMAQWEPLKVILPQVVQNSPQQSQHSQGPTSPLTQAASPPRPVRTNTALVVVCAVSGILGVGGLIWGFRQRSRASPPAVQPAAPQAQSKEANESRQPTKEQKIDVQELVKKSERGEPDSQAALGAKYYRGEDVPRDYTEALKWFRKAAEQGSPRGQNGLGLMHELGRGVPENPGEAFDLYTKAAAQGFGLAIDNLKRLKEEGFSKEYVEQLKTRPDTSTPQGALKAYLNCASWEDRLAFTRVAPGLRESMAAYYAKSRGSWPVRFDPQSLSVEPLLRPGLSNVFSVRVELHDRFDLKKAAPPYYVAKIGNEFKVDWLATQGVNSFKLLVFKSTRPTVPYTFRLLAKISDYYNYDYRGKQSTHFSIGLHEAGSYERIHGYVRKDTKTGQDLFKLLADGAEHEVVLELVYPVGSSETAITAISRVVALDWFVP